MPRPVVILAAASLAACADFTPGPPATAAVQLGGNGSGTATTTSDERSFADQIAHAIAVFERGPAAIDAAPPVVAREPAEVPEDLENFEELDEFEHHAVRIACSHSAPPEAEAESEPPFREFDWRIRAFINYPRVGDATSTAGSWCNTSTGRSLEDSVEAALENPDPLIRLRALVVLMRIGAPRSVQRQWRALRSLELGRHGPTFAFATAKLRAAFSPFAIDPVIAKPIPHFCHRRTQWAIRAAGVAGHDHAVVRLAEIAAGANEAASAAAAMSLGELAGPVADAALARCVTESAAGEWQAARALYDRNPERLRTALLLTPVAKRHRLHGRYLTRLNEPAGVPLLCDEAWRLDDADLDAITRLALPEHIDAVRAMPGRAREHMVDRVRQVVAAVRARLGL